MFRLIVQFCTFPLRYKPPECFSSGTLFCSLTGVPAETPVSPQLAVDRLDQPGGLVGSQTLVLEVFANLMRTLLLTIGFFLTSSAHLLNLLLVVLLDSRLQPPGQERPDFFPSNVAPADVNIVEMIFFQK